jgi:hypothetical protein
MSSKAAGYSPAMSAGRKSEKAAGIRRLLAHLDRLRAACG